MKLKVQTIKKQSIPVRRSKGKANPVRKLPMRLALEFHQKTRSIHNKTRNPFMGFRFPLKSTKTHFTSNQKFPQSKRKEEILDLKTRRMEVRVTCFSAKEGIN